MDWPRKYFWNGFEIWKDRKVKGDEIALEVKKQEWVWMISYVQSKKMTFSVGKIIIYGQFFGPKFCKQP